ncbi:GNAT family N-acetyltransferase [Actinophytocola sp. KF-1]
MPALPYPDPPLGDDVVVLRPWRAADVPGRFAAFDNPECLRFSWPLLEPFTQAHVAAGMRVEARLRAEGTDVHMAVADAADPDGVLGGCSLYDVDPVKASAAVGYWLRPEARGRGAASRTLRLLARWAFEALDIRRLELTCGPDNTASQNVAERCGFTFEGLMRSHLPFRGARRDTMLFSLLPGELT